MLRPRSQCRAEVLQRGAGVALREQGPREQIMRLGVPGLQPQRLAQQRGRQRRLVLVQAYAAEMEIRRGRIRAQFQRDLQMGGCLLRQSLIAQHQGVVEVGVGIFRIERDRPGDMPRRFFQIAQRAVGDAAVGVYRRGGGAAGERSFDQAHGLAVTAALMRDHAGQVQRSLVAGHIAQQLAIQRFGCIELAFVVQAYGALQLLFLGFLIHPGGAPRKKSVPDYSNVHRGADVTKLLLRTGNVR